MAPRPKHIEVYLTLGGSKDGIHWQYRTVAANGRKVSPHSESSHTRRWTLELARREAERYDPPLDVIELAPPP